MFTRDKDKKKMIVRQTIDPVFAVGARFVIRHPVRGASQVIVREHNDDFTHYILEDVDGSFYMTVPRSKTTELYPMKESEYE